ncbi:class I lanthipeptide [Sinomicrobium oceani]|uniref:class I lanthipeptide n=1 Tax=Sinomicrobium oceani TaxID=1150368 RepID=UPI00227BF73A|nr:class I lanthipeptide [Sinomicrobium oceani]
MKKKKNLMSLQLKKTTVSKLDQNATRNIAGGGTYTCDNSPMTSCNGGCNETNFQSCGNPEICSL